MTSAFSPPRLFAPVLDTFARALPHTYWDVPQKPQAEVIVDQDTAWRLFTKGLSQDAARTKVTILGDQSLGLKVLDVVSIIA
jgi:hypothetical protein